MRFGGSATKGKTGARCVRYSLSSAAASSGSGQRGPGRVLLIWQLLLLVGNKNSKGCDCARSVIEAMRSRRPENTLPGVDPSRGPLDLRLPSAEPSSSSTVPSHDVALALSELGGVRAASWASDGKRCPILKGIRLGPKVGGCRVASATVPLFCWSHQSDISLGSPLPGVANPDPPSGEQSSPHPPPPHGSSWGLFPGRESGGVRPCSPLPVAAASSRAVRAPSRRSSSATRVGLGSFRLRGGAGVCCEQGLLRRWQLWSS